MAQVIDKEKTHKVSNATGQGIRAGEVCFVLAVRLFRTKKSPAGGQGFLTSNVLLFQCIAESLNGRKFCEFKIAERSCLQRSISFCGIGDVLDNIGFVA